MKTGPGMKAWIGKNKRPATGRLQKTTSGDSGGKE